MDVENELYVINKHHLKVVFLNVLVKLVVVVWLCSSG